MEHLTECGSSLDFTRREADATPFDLGPNFRVALSRDGVDNVQLLYIYHQVAKFFLDNLEATALLELRLLFKSDNTLDRAALEQFLSVELVSMYLHLGF